MPSPFPGMNPYLEQADAWHDFHESFMPLARDLLVEQVDPKYIVKIDEHVYVHDLLAEDVHFVGRAYVTAADRGLGAEAIGATQTLQAPSSGRLPQVDLERVSYLEIRDRCSRRLVAVIELLSPANKRGGRDREQYLIKRGEVLAAQANLVEIDLLRGGEPMPLEDTAESTYRVVVARYEQWPHADVWPFELHDPLPTIPVPLNPPDPEPRLDLQAMLHRIYDSARYGTYLYDNPPDPPLSRDELAWSQTFVPQAG